MGANVSSQGCEQISATTMVGGTPKLNSIQQNLIPLYSLFSLGFLVYEMRGIDIEYMEDTQYAGSVLQALVA